jgi:hypothetical protein
MVYIGDMGATSITICGIIRRGYFIVTIPVSVSVPVSVYVPKTVLPISRVTISFSFIFIFVVTN